MSQCNLENILEMFKGVLKSILIAHQENPSQIPDICEKMTIKFDRLQKREIVRKAL